MEREYLTLRTEIKALKAELAELEDRAKVIEVELLEDWSHRGLSSMRLDGSTLYLRHDLWAGVAKDEPDRHFVLDTERQRACEALRAAGLDELVRLDFSTQSLSAWVRERLRDGGELPAEFEGAINVSEVFSIRVRKS